MAPGWKDPSEGAYYLYVPAQDPAVSNELYAILERRALTDAANAQMRALQVKINGRVKMLDKKMSHYADEGDGTLADGDVYVILVELLPRATIPYLFSANSKAWDTLGEGTFGGFSGKRGNILIIRKSGASGTNVNLFDGSTKGLEAVALPSMKKESFAALILSDKVNGDFIMQTKRLFYGPAGLKPPLNPKFANAGEYRRHLEDCLNRGLVPDPYVLSPGNPTPLSADTLKVDGLACLYGTWRRLGYDPAQAILTPAVHLALIKFFKHHATDAPLDWDLVVEACIVTRFIEAHMPLSKGSYDLARRNRREPFYEALPALGANAVDSHSVPIVTPAVSILYYQHWPAYHERRGMVSYMHPWRFAYTRYEDDKKRASPTFTVNDEVLDWELVAAWVDSLSLDLRAEYAPQQMPGSVIRGWSRQALDDWGFARDPAPCFGDVRRQGLPNYQVPEFDAAQGRCPPWKLLVPADSLHPVTDIKREHRGVHGWVYPAGFTNSLGNLHVARTAAFPGPTLKLPCQADGSFDWDAMRGVFFRNVPRGGLPLVRDAELVPEAEQPEFLHGEEASEESEGEGSTISNPRRATFALQKLFPRDALAELLVALEARPDLPERLRLVATLCTVPKREMLPLEIVLRPLAGGLNTMNVAIDQMLIHYDGLTFPGRDRPDPDSFAATFREHLDQGDELAERAATWLKWGPVSCAQDLLERILQQWIPLGLEILRILGEYLDDDSIEELHRLMNKPAWDEIEQDGFDLASHLYMAQFPLSGLVATALVPSGPAAGALYRVGDRFAEIRMEDNQQFFAGRPEGAPSDDEGAFVRLPVADFHLSGDLNERAGSLDTVPEAFRPQLEARGEGFPQLPGQHVARLDWIDRGLAELDIRVGDVITNVVRLDGNWMLGAIVVDGGDGDAHRRVGVFPACVVTGQVEYIEAPDPYATSSDEEMLG